MTHINFKAKYLDTINVLKKDKNNYFPHAASVVEIDRTNKQDLRALQEVNKLWKGNIFADAIIYSYDNPKCTADKILAVTIQNQDYNAILPDKVIGLINLELTDSTTTVHMIESKDWNNKDTREYFQVGTALIKYIQTKTKEIRGITLNKQLMPKVLEALGFKENIMREVVWHA